MYKVEKFTEKPDLKTAEFFLDQKITYGIAGYFCLTQIPLTRNAYI